MAPAIAFLSSHALFSPSLTLRLSKASALGFLRSHSLRVEVANASPFLHRLVASGSCRLIGRICGSGSQSSFDSSDMLGSSSSDSDQEEDEVPMPIVLIDQVSDSNGTIVRLSFGDRLGELVDTLEALRDIGLDVTKGTVTTESSVMQTEIFISRLGRRVEDPTMLEIIRLTIINNLLKYHPESSEKLAMANFFGINPPEKKLDVDIATRVFVQDDGPKRSLLYVETADRPGLLLEIIKIIVDINIAVQPAEINTEGLVAKNKFHVSYKGAALVNSLRQALTNSLRYYLTKPEIDESSY